MIIVGALVYEVIFSLDLDNVFVNGDTTRNLFLFIF